MKAEKIINAIGEIEDEYVEEAHKVNKKKIITWANFGKFSLAAMCLILVVAIVPNFFQSYNGTGADKGLVYESEGYYVNDKAMSNGIVADESKAESAGLDLTVNKKLIVTGNINLETLDLDKILGQIGDNISQYGAYIQDSSINTSGYRRIYEATIRIPADNYQDFLNNIKGSGNVTYYHENTKDITDTYTNLDAKLTSLKAQEAKVLEFYKEAENISDLMAIEERLSNIRYEIDYIETQLKNYDLQISYSTLYITVTETKEYTETSESFFTRLGNSFVNGWHNFIDGIGDFVVDVVYNIWTIIIIVLLGFGAYKLYKHIKNKRNKK